MITESVLVGSLVPHPDNPRRGDVSVIKDSLVAHGQYRPLVIQTSTGRVLVGNHTLRAIKELGWTKVDVVKIDVDDNQAKRIMLVDNRASDKAGYEDAELITLLKSFDNEDLEGTGFSNADLEELIRISNEADMNIKDIIPREKKDKDKTEGREYYQLSYPVTSAQRTIVQDKLREAREHFGYETVVETLVRICEDWTP